MNLPVNLTSNRHNTIYTSSYLGCVLNVPTNKRTFSRDMKVTDSTMVEVISMTIVGDHHCHKGLDHLPHHTPMQCQIPIPPPYGDDNSTEYEWANRHDQFTSASPRKPKLCKEMNNIHS